MAKQVSLTVPGKVSSTDILVTAVDQMTVADKEMAFQTKSKLKTNLQFVVYQGPLKIRSRKEVKTA